MKSLAIHGVLALAGLFAAFRVWSARNEPEAAAESVVVVDCERSELEGVTLSADGKTTRVDVQREGGETRYRFTVTRESGDTGAPDDAAHASLRTEEEDSEPKRFLGGEAAVEYAEKVSPLRAIRSLGEPGEEVLGDIELDEPKGTFTYRCGGRSHAFELGGEAFGSGDRYVREQGGSAVYLLSADVVRELGAAETRMMQRDFHRFEWTEVAQVTLQIGDAQRTLLQRERQTPQQARWVDEAEPDRRNELFDNLMGRIRRVQVRDYLAPDVAPGEDRPEDELGAPETALTLVYRDAGGDEIGRLELKRAESDLQVFYYGRSGVTGSWTTVARSTGVQVEDDARLALGLDPVERPEDRASDTESEAPPEGEAVSDGEASAMEPPIPEPPPSMAPSMSASPQPPSLPPSVGAPSMTASSPATMRAPSKAAPSPTMTAGPTETP